ncbi:unnamed protein product [Darwinula stevensoni]|uniref:3CxxC-type domain-containing protein n=1 Tax=Darwinula stevensoni TaxID=69355 RepID=A0A7R9A0J1_9CRUS|nr:unnamed protein product [Darwinula stevensoni]CAG0881259.1 unnamed protein product [Darwinula stevensoni]
MKSIIMHLKSSSALTSVRNDLFLLNSPVVNSRLFTPDYKGQYYVPPKIQAHDYFGAFSIAPKLTCLLQKCNRVWTSRNGRVIFYHNLDFLFDVRGEVVFKLMGQQCMKCKGRFENPICYPEEVLKLIWNIWIVIRCYWYEDQGTGIFQIRRERRSGRPGGPHLSQSCEACLFGGCSCSTPPFPFFPLPSP